MRQLIPLTLIGLLLLPDWASALGGRYYPPCPPPAIPECVCPPNLVIIPQCLPSFEVLPQTTTPSGPLRAPTVTPEAAKPEAAKPEAAKPETPLQTPPKAPAPGVPPGRSSRESVTPDTNVKQVELVVPNIPSPSAAKPEAAKPELQTPPRVAPTQPQIQVPAPPVASPAVANPAIPSPAVPSASGPGTTTTEAKRDVDMPRIPALRPQIPGADSGLPALIVPPPSNDPPGSSTSRSSPLNQARNADFQVIPVDGAAPESPTALRKVGFFNHSDRDIRLTVQSQTITLPKRHSVTAEVPAKFVWKIDGNLEQTTEIPLAVPGVEVVIRR